MTNDANELEIALVRGDWDYASDLLTTSEPTFPARWLMHPTDSKRLESALERRGYFLRDGGGHFEVIPNQGVMS
jgi:hypothetical protein